MKRLLAATAVLPVLLLTACGGSDDTAGSGAGPAGTAAGDAGAQTVEVDSNDQLKFAPETINAKVGKLTLTNKNVGKIPHNLVFDDAALGKTGTVSGGESDELVLDLTKAGDYTFVCTFHSGMTGKVVVS